MIYVYMESAKKFGNFQPSFVSGFRLVMADYWSGLIPRYSSLGLTLNEGVRGSLQLTIGPHHFEATQFKNGQLKIFIFSDIVN